MKWKQFNINNARTHRSKRKCVLMIFLFWINAFELRAHGINREAPSKFFNHFNRSVGFCVHNSNLWLWCCDTGMVLCRRQSWLYSALFHLPINRVISSNKCTAKYLWMLANGFNLTILECVCVCVCVPEMNVV